ncbi:MAG: hypothetical protein OEZ39_17125 [Gammaproteobacteria bacterium]|nr:hypothetical protein [Gammaproteobacteria bacterium]MDH5653585.1 hypothetical protein [Gammaproteobacteria bacterium]
MLIEDRLIDGRKSENASSNGEEVGVARLVFKNNEIDDRILVFTSSCDGYANVFCTEAFKTEIEKNGLTDVVFNTSLAINPLEI